MSLGAVAVVGTGLIGGSVGLALRAQGVRVVGIDVDANRSRAALDAGVLDEVLDLEVAAPEVDLVVVAVPVSTVANLAIAALDAGARVVTDVGSVKAPVLMAVEAARPELAERFVGGHPMAGSEQEGLEGADPDLFAGATWVLTPTEHTGRHAFAVARSMVAALGAEVLPTTPEHHDALVAVVSHVPQLAATTLMDVAATSGEEQTTLLRLAAGGFRDMTRIAAGHPGIWPDICVANRDAIVAGLDGYLAALQRVRELVAGGDRDGLLQLLERARDARRSLPVGLPTGEPIAELRVPVPDRPGVVAEITSIAGNLAVNVADLEIAHSAEGGGGVLVLVVAAHSAPRLEAALAERGYHSSWTALP